MIAYEAYLILFLSIAAAGLITIVTLALTRPDYKGDN